MPDDVADLVESAARNILRSWARSRLRANGRRSPKPLNVADQRQKLKYRQPPAPRDELCWVLEIECALGRLSQSVRPNAGAILVEGIVGGERYDTIANRYGLMRSEIRSVIRQASAEFVCDLTVRQIGADWREDLVA